MQTIQLTQGKVTLVDDDVYVLYGHLNWAANFQNGNWYAVRTINNKLTKLHHLVIGKPPKGLLTDHIDGNGLNNQRDNLHFVTNRQNLQNRVEHRNGHLVGTYFRKTTSRWLAQIRINGKKKYLGSFNTELEAHQAYKSSLDFFSLKSIIS